MITPYQHQEELSNDALEILRENAIVYLAMEERTGKTITALLVAEKSAVSRVLIVTKKKAEKDWKAVLGDMKLTKSYTLTTYHQLHNLSRFDYDLVLLDESHNYISAFPKPGQIWKQLRPICKGKPIVYISATPHAQGLQQLFHQFALSSWSPWYKHTNFYSWFQMYGKPYNIEINGINVPQYTKLASDTVVYDCVKHLFITKTRSELGFEHEPEDRLHWIELSDNVRQVYNTLLKDELIELSVGTLVCDNASKMRTSLHQLEGGTIKIEDKYCVLGNLEKVNYILETFGDTEGLVIMYNFKAELTKLQMYFKKASLLQATSFAEGVDLHKYDDLVIYSQDYSTARHTQRRARQCNKERDTPITVHFLLVKKGISEQVYKTVSINKKNYVDSTYSRSFL